MLERTRLLVRRVGASTAGNWGLFSGGLRARGGARRGTNRLPEAADAMLVKKVTITRNAAKSAATMWTRD